MISNYTRYLNSLHARQTTQEEIIKNIIQEASNQDLLSKKRIIAGEVNEIYKITLSDKSQVILRISQNGYPNFQQERWVMKECKKVGVPAPEILLIKYLTIHNQEYGFCLMKKMDGDLLERGVIEFNKSSRSQHKSYVNQAGRILSKIHSIQTSGFGRIVGEGKSQYKNADQSFANWLDKRDLYEKTCREASLDLAVIKTAFKLGRYFKDKFLEIKPRLNHGDFFPKHFMIKKGKIIGILDWGEIRSDSPIYDFANWDFWVGKNFPTKWLKDGYTNNSLFDNDFDDLLHFLKITIGLDVFEWYHKQKYQEMVEKTIAKLTWDINYFK